MHKRWLFTSFALLCWMAAPLAQAGAEDLVYAGTTIQAPDGWKTKDSKLFSGSVPSKAWVIKSTDGAEILVSTLVTEGIVNGLSRLSMTVVAKSYVEAVAVSWGAVTKGDPEGKLEPFCGGQAGYRLSATFGNVVFDYFGCLVPTEENKRVITATTWIKRINKDKMEENAELLAKQRLLPIVQNVLSKSEQTGNTHF